MGVASDKTHARLARVSVRPDVQAGKADRRREGEFDRAGYSPVVVGRACAIGHHLAAVRSLRQHHIVYPAMGWIKDAHGQQVLLAWLEGVGHVQLEGRLAALVTADRDSVQPHFGQIIHLPEAQQRPPTLIRIYRRRKGTPVPGQTVIAGEGILDDPRYAGSHGLRARSQLPVALFPQVVWVGRKQPVFAIEASSCYRGRYRLSGGAGWILHKACESKRPQLDTFLASPGKRQCGKAVEAGPGWHHERRGESLRALQRDRGQSLEQSARIIARFQTDCYLVYCRRQKALIGRKGKFTRPIGCKQAGFTWPGYL